MKLHELKASGNKKPKRIGRSGKRGSYSGRGVKGQKSRSGRRLRPAERDLILRLPKRRGFANARKSEKAIIFNLGDLAEALKSFATAGKGVLDLNAELLKAAGLLKKGFQGEVKLLGEGEISFPVKVAQGFKVSGSAKAKIEKAGGNVG
ncbi:MAG TPA: uL15 family ribosomal protein [Candidatus Paceibacterota bacterium]|nr:uL15 family ribosomal protein [Candidatus Paceibacterota bacterium]